jgi:uncharacterized protein
MIFLKETSRRGENNLFLHNKYNFTAHLHLFKTRGLNIILDVNSGAIHCLDDSSYEYITRIIELKGDWEQAQKDLTDKYNQQELKEITEEIEAAYHEGALFSDPQLLEINRANFHVKALCLNVAHACNMKCHYCFASQGDFGMQPSLMSLETGKKALDFLIEKSGAIKNLEVDFFGGEPLLVADMLKELVAYGRKREREAHKRFNFTLTTNCTLLDADMMDFVIANDISVILSLDGRKATNDKHRIFNNGEGTYDTIIPNIKQMVKRNPVSYYVRGTFTRHNLDFASDLKHMVEQGFDCISIEPATGIDNGYSIQPQDIPQVKAEYERLTDLFLDYYKKGQEIHFFHYDLQLQGGPCLAKRTSGCGAGVEYLVVTPEGDIYPCHQFVGEKEFYMGNIFDNDTNQDIKEIFVNNQLVDKKECLNCWARYFCGGGCHAHAYFINHDMKKPPQTACQLLQKRVEEAIYLEIAKQNLP